MGCGVSNGSEKQVKKTAGAVFFTFSVPISVGSNLRQISQIHSKRISIYDEHHPWKISSGKNADTVTLGKSTALLILKSTATLHIM